MTTELRPDPPETFADQLDRVEAMLDGDFDWEAYDGPMSGPRDAFRSVCRATSIDVAWKVPMAEVGSRRIEDTPAALYRLLWLARPKGVDFSDMYKSGLFAVESPCGRYGVTVELYKYEFGLYFHAPRDTVPPKAVCGGLDITSGIPGSDNGWRTTDPVAVRFFDFVCAAAGREYLVYGGNDFVV